MGRGHTPRDSKQPSNGERIMTAVRSAAREEGGQRSREGVGAYSMKRWEAQPFKEDPWHGFVAKGGCDNHGARGTSADKAVSIGANGSIVARAGSFSTQT